jgi:hypothetical protein
MSSYKTDQRFVVHRGRTFHFVSYEGVAANEARSVEAVPATWFLMGAGKRFAVMPQALVDGTDIETQLVQWLEDNVFDPSATPPIAALDPPPSRGRGGVTPAEATAARAFAAKRHYR